MDHCVYALARFVIDVAQLLSHVHALLSTRHRHVSLWALAVILSLVVYAVSDSADQRMQSALVDVDAARLGLVENETLVAGAHEAPECVRAVTVLADVLVLLALVYVLEDNGHPVGAITRTAGTQILKLFCSVLRTLFATSTPRVADAAAARRLRYRRRHVEDALRTTTDVLQAREAQRFSSIC